MPLREGGIKKKRATDAKLVRARACACRPLRLPLLWLK